MTHSNIRLIIFDWDDVFTLGSTAGYLRCYHRALEELGVRLDPAEEKKRIFAKWGQSHREELRELLKERPHLLDEACRLYEAHLFGTTFVDALTIVPGAKEILLKLHDHYLLAIATGINPVILRERVIPTFGIPDVFLQILSAYDLPDPAKAKPDPYMVESILKTQNVAPGEAIMVGDATNDVLMAQAACVTPVVVLSGHLNKNQAESLGVKHIIPDVTHIEEVLFEIKRNA